MYPLSPLYADYLKRLDRQFIAQVTVNGEVYDMSTIVDFQIENSLSLSDGFEIGNVIPSKLTIKLRTNDVIPANARMAPALSLSVAALTWLEATYPWLDTNVSWTGTSTDWMPLGEFYVDTREKINGVWTFVCYDKLRQADQPYVSSLTYPASMQDVWNEMMGRLGWTSDSSVVINPAYLIQVGPAGFTYRQVMGHIASANSASVYAGKEGIIKFKRFLANASPVFEMTASSYTRVKMTNPVKTYTRVVVTYNTEDELSYEAGSGDDNHTLSLVNPFATQAMVNGIHAALSGFAYLPVYMEGMGFPQLDHGDVIGFERLEGGSWIETVSTWSGTDIPWNGIVEYQTLIMHQVFSFGGGLRMTIEAPSTSEQQSEFPVRGSISSAINALNKTALKEGRNYYGMTVTREAGLFIEREDHGSDVVLNSDKFAFRAGGVDKIYFDPVSGRYKFNGTLEATDGVFSGSLSAATGTFAGELQAASGTFRGALQAASGTFNGELLAASGTFTGNLNAAGGTFRGALEAATGSFVGALDAASGTFRGALQAASGSFTGELQAASGSFSGAITASSISGGTVTGALIQTSASGYPRAEMSSSNKVFSVAASASNRVEMTSAGYPIAGVGLSFLNGGQASSISANSGLYVYGDPTITMEAMNIFLRGYNGAYVSRWSDFRSEETGTSIQSELNALTGLINGSAVNMTFDPASRNLKLWSRGGSLLAQVNIPA